MKITNNETFNAWIELQPRKKIDTCRMLERITGIKTRTLQNMHGKHKMTDAALKKINAAIEKLETAPSEQDVNARFLWELQQIKNHERAIIVDFFKRSIAILDAAAKEHDKLI